ncbi:TIGR01777 family oxidoreductase [Microbacter margulisiae]|uniref:NAD-dependent epimerase/dehydratase domain-containing protein n=1 Tax=Microbacter margulisiae TaxID=1350067 RepID=A0A7W5H184_9PORP|nr:TIGR01777 family oxidoreductase [Microbacter margulisiae]MBB3186092.1 hypothetical protein [Microbacter margulisiae]
MQEKPKPTLILAGGTGFIGKHATEYFAQIGYHIIVLTRGESRYEHAVRYVHWDAKNVDGWHHLLDGAVGIFNFTGHNIQAPPTETNRKEIMQSRIASVKALTKAMSRCTNPPPLFVQMSAVGFYGNTVNTCTEQSPVGKGFMADVCNQWEQTFMQADLPQTRKIILRLGVVLAKDGGALPLLVKLTRSFLGTTVGSGKQGISWIHINDLMQILRCTLYKSQMQGIYNATSPNPTSNKLFMKTLRKLFHRPWLPPVPSFIASGVARTCMKRNPEVLLTGCYAIPKRLEAENCFLQFKTLDTALPDLFRR